MSRLGIFACLLVLVAVAVCVDMPPNMKALEPPKDGAKFDSSRRDHQLPAPRPEGSRPEGSRPEAPRPEGSRPEAPRPEGKPELPKGDNPKPDAKAPQDGKS